jgi:hypothetical protein
MRNRKKIIWLGVLALVVLHHDFWWWDDPTLVFGFLPIGLAYHVGFSVAASALWFAYIKFAWPTHVEEFAEGDPTIPPESKPPAP